MRIHKKPRFFSKIFHWFTLVELIVVISVLAVLASIAMSQVSNITAWARDSQRMTDMSAMKSSIELYKAKTGKLPIPTNGSGVTYSWALLWTQGTFGEPTWRQLNSITPKPVDPTNSIEYVYSVANNNREFELGGILEKATGLAPSLFPELLAASQNVTFIEGTYNGVSLKVETGSKTYVVAAPSLIGGYLGDAKMENTGLTIEGLGSLPKGFSGVVVSTAQTGTFTPVIAWSGSKLPETSTGAEAMIIGLQNAYSGSNATSLSQISSLVSATGSQITALWEGLVENALGGDIGGTTSTSGGGSTYCSSHATVSTVLGSTQGYVDGSWIGAKISNPGRLVFDASGFMYLADNGNHRIRKISNDGLYTTSLIAGDGAANYLDGIWTASKFTNPMGIAIDGSGNIYVADTWNYAIRKIANDANRTVTTIAGSPGAGTTDGAGASAKFNLPEDIAIDSAWNLYVTDNGNHRIRKIANDANRTVSIYAGWSIGFADGNNTSALFKYPEGITIDSAGNLYVADRGNNRIRKIANDANRTVTTIAGNGTAGYVDGIGTSAQFYEPYDVAIDVDGNLYITDASNYVIRKIANDANKTVTTLAGIQGSPGTTNGPVLSARFKHPRGITIDDAGNLFVSDYTGQQIRKISCQ